MKNHIITVGIVALIALWVWASVATSGLVLAITFVLLLTVGFYVLILDMVMCIRERD